MSATVNGTGVVYLVFGKTINTELIWYTKIMDLKIKFELNKELDKEMALVFLKGKSKVGGIDFSLGVINPHPALEKLKETEEINKYFDNYYSEHGIELINANNKAQEDWRSVEGNFFDVVKSIFVNPPVPEGKYVAYLSIINCNPRFLDNKTFQVYWKHRNGTNMVVAHEVLHFFFYDYAETKHPDLFRGLEKNTGLFWVLAEVFNDVVLSLPELVAVHGQTTFYSYPAHKKYSEHMGKIWEENPDIDEWLLKGYDYLVSVLK